MKRLEESASSPKKVEVDNQTVEQHSLYEQIALDKYLAAKKNADTPSGGWGGVRFAKRMPPSAIH
jgi:hypothetical protein